MVAWTAAAAATVLAGCATLPPPDAAGRTVIAPLEVAGESVEALWQLPAPALGRPAALLLLQHGYARRCSHLQTTARQLMAQGLVVLCVEASMAGGNRLLAEALAAALLTLPGLPDGRPLPPRWIVGGHSAGAVFAVHLGARVAALAPQRLAGALLLDPVAAPGFDADLQAVSAGGTRPVLAILAAPGPCNAQRNADAALRAVPGVIGAEAPAAATHIDAEGEDSDALARAVCGQPLPANVAWLRALAAAWAGELAQGVAPTLPAGVQPLR